MSDIKQFNLNNGQRAERKLLVTVAEWKEKTTVGTTVTTETVREILGTRTEDSSIDYNADIQTSTDILGNNYTDLNKTQPQQDFDPFLVLGGSRLGAFLNDIRRRNAVSELNQFTMYIITLFIGSEGVTSGTTFTGGYEAERHDDCTIAYTSIGGDSNVNFPISVYFSNKITTGKIDQLKADFEFLEDREI